MRIRILGGLPLQKVEFLHEKFTFSNIPTELRYKSFYGRQEISFTYLLIMVNFHAPGSGSTTLLRKLPVTVDNTGLY
jgi:hypothetical protein